MHSTCPLNLEKQTQSCTIWIYFQRCKKTTRGYCKLTWSTFSYWCKWWSIDTNTHTGRRMIWGITLRFSGSKGCQLLPKHWQAKSNHSQGNEPWNTDCYIHNYLFFLLLGLRIIWLCRVLTSLQTWELLAHIAWVYNQIKTIDTRTEQISLSMWEQWTFVP